LGLFGSLPIVGDGGYTSHQKESIDPERNIVKRYLIDVNESD